MKIIKLDNLKLTKALIFDSSSIITLNMIDMLDILKKLKIMFNGKFLITKEVYKEIINVPLGIKKYELRALIVKKAIEEGILDVVESNSIDKKTNEILEKANSLFSVNGESIRIIHRGEASCIALYLLLNIENKNKAMVIDERTTRMLLENPKNLHKLLESKLHREILMNKKIADEFVKENIRVIRSSELLYYAFIKNKIDLINGEKTILDALLYAAKAYGCSIAREEIERLKKKI